MNSQYINCPKCGTRNFADDKVCGICKTKLAPTTNSNTNSQRATQPINYKTILLIIGGLLFVYYAFIKDSGTKRSSNEASNEYYLENSPEAQLAIINDQTKAPKQITINIFNGLLTSLKNKYSNRTKQEIANALVASHNIIIKNEKSNSLLEFTTAFDAYSREVDSKYKFSIEEALALFIKLSYQI